MQLVNVISEVLAEIGEMFADSAFWTGPKAIQPKTGSGMTTLLSLIRLSIIIVDLI